VHTVPLGNNDEAGAVKAERAAETAEGKVYDGIKKALAELEVVSSIIPDARRKKYKATTIRAHVNRMKP